MRIQCTLRSHISGFSAPSSVNKVPADALRPQKLPEPITVSKFQTLQELHSFPCCQMSRFAVKWSQHGFHSLKLLDSTDDSESELYGQLRHRATLSHSPHDLASSTAQSKSGPNWSCRQRHSSRNRKSHRRRTPACRAHIVLTLHQSIAVAPKTLSECAHAAALGLNSSTQSS